MTTSRGDTDNNSPAKRIIKQLTLLRISLALIVIIVLFAVAFGVQRARELESEYQVAVGQIEGIQQLAASDEIYSLTQDDMVLLENEFRTLQDRIDHIEALSDLPLGLDNAIGGTPWLSDRYKAGMETLEVGRMLAEAGEVIANVGEESLRALDDTGIRAEPGNNADTWLDVLNRRESELNAALDKMDEATLKRQEIDESQLPSGVQHRLRQIDSVMEEFADKRELAEDLPLAFTALGAEKPVRYLVLFQNPSETRPTGGFVGTVAFVEIERGQILEYEFHDVYEISKDYKEKSEEGIDPPWAISKYVRADHLQYQDANWWPDFPVTAQQYMEMTVDAGWPAVDSVVAVQPEAITDLISITGPISVEVDGEEREITTENLLEESERQRRLAREGEEVATGHKEVISLIGEVLLAHLADGNRDDMVDGAFLMFDALDRRDMQAYHENDNVQAFLEERTWAGLMQPEPDIPTLAAVFANVTGLKTSLVMQPSMHLELLESSTEGTFEGVLTLSLDHFGDDAEDPFYEGFQRWWVDVSLPEGSRVVEKMPEPAPDPDASNGGAYIVDLDVGENEEISIRFTMPETDALLIRRQPGLQLMQGNVQQSGCDESLTFTGDTDQTLLLDHECPVIEPATEDE